MIDSMTRVVVLLVCGQHLSVYFATLQGAQNHIHDWAVRCKERIRKGDVQGLETALVEFSNAEGGIGGAYLERYVIGMYMPNDAPSPSERIAAAVEKQVSEGEGWKE